jgi:predicted ATPase
LAIPQFLSLLERRKVGIHELAATRDFREPEFVESSNQDLQMDSSWRDFISKAELGGNIAHHDGGPEAAAEAHLKAAFEEASGCLVGKPTTIPLPWGRSMTVDEAAGGAGRFSFTQLCGESLNADDYLRLADHFHTFVVADVPRFTMNLHNEARRFTNLIDCLYERHGRLVVSADVPPRQLLSEMEELTGYIPNPLGEKRRQGPPPPVSDWVPQSPFSSEASSPVKASVASRSGRAGTGDDDAATGADIAGVMTAAVASLQESGFAAKRAVSRLLHMQSAEYLEIHRQHRRSS